MLLIGEVKTTCSETKQSLEQAHTESLTALRCHTLTFVWKIVGCRSILGHLQFLEYKNKSCEQHVIAWYSHEYYGNNMWRRTR